ncbi:hypothetical protein PTKIN_Ptkin17bG0147200 [Pterospermum kingtungense]
MTTQMDSSATDALDIGNAFVQRFYTILHKDPTQAFRFYLDSSALSRPGPDGVMKSVTTVEDINELILSLDCQSYKAKITFAHAQFSYGNGLIVLVTGCLIGKNDARRKFTQSFFLAPQERGYYVLNDVFRYIDDEEPEDAANNDLNESTEAALYPEPEVTQVPNNVEANHASAPSDDGDYTDKEVSHPLDNDNVSVLENEVVAVQPAPSSEKSLNDSDPVSQTASPRIEDDAPKKSYLTVVHALTQNSSPFISRPPPPKPKPVAEQSRKAAAPEASAPQSNNVSERNNDFSGKNTSIFVANLPLNATEEMLSEAFKNFGPIKPNGIQVRSFKENKNCFGFVEFESAASVQSAVTVLSCLVSLA